MRREGMTMEVYVDLDTGMRRTGVAARRRGR